MMTQLPIDDLQKNLPGMSIAGVAGVISADWGSKVNYAAKPYLEAMYALNSITDSYYLDSGHEIVLRFLCNAGTWRGPVAKIVKTELKKRAGLK